MRETPEGRALEASGANIVATERLVVKSGYGFAAARVRRQAEWIINQSQRVASRFPTVLAVYSDGDSTSVTMLRSDMKPLDDLLLSQSISGAAAADLVASVVAWVAATMHTDLAKPWTCAPEYMIERVKCRLLSIPAEYCPVAHHLIHGEVVSINGIEMPGLLRSVDRAYLALQRFQTVNVNERQFCNVHGDLHSGNILTNGSDFILIDPRGGFDGENTNFDADYDFGKLFHDTECGYSLIKKGVVSLENKGLSVCLTASALAALSPFQAINERIIWLLGGVESERCRRAQLFGPLLLAGAAPFHLRFHRRALAMIAASLARLNGSFPLSLCRPAEQPE